MVLVNYRILLLFFNLVTGLWCQKMLSELKKCGDPECEGTISRVQANKDFKGPDCRYLNFKAGEVIFVYYKLSGKRDDLWAGSIGMQFGYFPKDAVNVEEEYVSKEVEVSTEETDFFCLNGDEYIPESEDGKGLNEHFDTSLLENPNAEKEGSEGFPDGNLQKHMHVSLKDLQYNSVGHATTGSVKDLSQQPEMKDVHNSMDSSDTLKASETESYVERQEAKYIHDSYVESSWIGSHVKGWLGLESNKDQEDTKPVIESLQANSFRSRKIAVASELKEVNEQVEPEPEKSSWFGGGVTDFLGFGKKRSEPVLPDTGSETQKHISSSDSISDSITSQREDNSETLKVSFTDSKMPQNEEIEQKSEDKQLEEVTDDEGSKSSWFNLGLSDILSFRQRGKDKTSDYTLLYLQTEEVTTSDDTLLQLKTEEVTTSDNTLLQLKTEQVTAGDKKETSVINEEANEDIKENEEKIDSINTQDGAEKTDIQAKEKMGWRYMDFGNLLNFGNSHHHKAESQSTAQKMDCQNKDEKEVCEGHEEEQAGAAVEKKMDQSDLKASESVMASDSETTVSNSQTKERKDDTMRSEENPKRVQEHKIVSDQIIQQKDKDHSLKIPFEQYHNSIQQLKPNTISQMGAQKGNRDYLANTAVKRNKALSESDSQFQEEDVLNENDTSNSKYHWHILEIFNILKPIWIKLEPYTNKVVAALPEDMRPGPDLYGLPWEAVIFTAFIGFFTTLVLVCRTCQAVRSRLYIAREKKLSNEVSELLEEKCKTLETLSSYKQQYEKLDSSLKDAERLNESTKTSCLQDTCAKLSKSNIALQDSIEQLKQELEAEKSKREQQNDLLADVQKNLQLLEAESRTLRTQTEEARTTVKVFQINRERLQTSLQAAREENSLLQESNEQLLKEAEGWGERFNELTEQIKMFELSKKDMEEVLSSKDGQVMSLTACLLKIKDWDSEVEGDNVEENNTWDLEIRGETENGEYLVDEQQKRKVKKLIYAAKLNAALKSLEAEKNEVYAKLSDEVKAKQELAERIEKLQSEEISLRSESSYFVSEVQKLQQKLKVMAELYQENEMQLHRKLTVEERQRLQKEEKLSKADEKMNLAAEELKSYRQRAQDLEEELERTIQSYKNQISLHEKKAHDNWLAARAAEREVGDISRENTHLRQKLTESEFKLDMVEKDPYALDVQNRAYFREHSPYGPLPLSRPASETRAFLSPPTLMEGPPRLSPLFLGVPGGRASRGLISHPDQQLPNESGELSSDRLSDHHGAHSDSGSLSPTWERERRISVPPSGVLYRRSEIGYHVPVPTGRMSGPAELRTYSSHSFDKPDEYPSVENSLESAPDASGSKGNINSMRSASGGQPLAPNRETSIGSGFTAPHPPPIRGPLLPLDPRGHFFRRGPVPLPGGMYGPPDYLPPREFIGLPPPPMRMRGPPPPGQFLRFPPARDGFLPAGQLPPESRPGLAARVSPPSSQLAAESAAPQHDN